MGLTRRDFARVSILLASLRTGSASEPGWWDRPMRWSQLTLTEDDPPKLDLKFWLGYFARIHSDAACLSAGGVVAYYPTRVPHHYRSRWLGDRDPFWRLGERMPETGHGCDCADGPARHPPGCR